MIKHKSQPTKDAETVLKFKNIPNYHKKPNNFSFNQVNKSNWKIFFLNIYVANIYPTPLTDQTFGREGVDGICVC